MPNTLGVNRRRLPRKPEEPQFLRKVFPGFGRGASARVVRIIVLVIAAWFSSAILLGDSGLISILRMRSMQRSLERDIRTLEEVKAQTIELREDLTNDPRTIERVAREEYGMIRDGEICYRVRLDEETQDSR
ncbi:MAG: septum formation initiator family protein [Candidatus Eisenbacteria bacterium]|nr:septum formation initiator family protein [Candidatus Eisenbacteria bacterium]